MLLKINLSKKAVLLTGIQIELATVRNHNAKKNIVNVSMQDCHALNHVTAPIVVIKRDMRKIPRVLNKIQMNQLIIDKLFDECFNDILLCLLFITFTEILQKSNF